MAEEDLTFPGWVKPYSDFIGENHTATLPYPYEHFQKYDLQTALYQGTLFPWLDDHWRRKVRKENM